MEAKARELEITWLDKSAPMLLHKLRSFMQVGAHSRALGHATLALTPIRAYIPVRTHTRTPARTLHDEPQRCGCRLYGRRSSASASSASARRTTRRSSRHATAHAARHGHPIRRGYPTAARVSRTAWPNRSAHYSGHCGRGRSRAPHFAHVSNQRCACAEWDANAECAAGGPPADCSVWRRWRGWPSGWRSCRTRRSCTMRRTTTSHSGCARARSFRHGHRAPKCTMPKCIAEQCSAVQSSSRAALHCTALHCTALHCTAHHCTAL